MDRDSVEVFLPDPDECYERLRRARFGATVSCVYEEELPDLVSSTANVIEMNIASCPLWLKRPVADT